MSKQGCLIAAIAALSIAVAGCGGSDKKSNRANAYTAPATTGSDFQATGSADQQDAEAKANARNLVAEVEACFVDQQDYGMCKQPAGTRLPLGSGPGQVEVSEAATATYTVVAHSKSGTDFEVKKDDQGGVTRACDKDGQGGCKAGGTW
jgi:type IV pilus assembly protein PilA